MKPSIEKLYKFLKLEVEQGFNDRAVVGGLRNMLDSWEAEARAEEMPNLVIQAVTARLRDYHQLTPGSREETLQGLWKRLNRSMKDEGLPVLFPGEAPRPKKSAAPQKQSQAQQKPPVAQAKQKSEPVAKSEPVKKKSTPKPKSKSDARPAPKEKPKPKKAPVPLSFSAVPPVPENEQAALNAPLTVLDGVGPKTAEAFSSLGINSLGDALYYFPRRYDDYSELKPINRLNFGDEVTIIGTVNRVSTRSLGGKRKLTEAILSDGSGALRITWFNQPWLEKALNAASQIVVSGKIDQYLGRLVMTSPEWEPLERENLNTNRIVPVYPLTAKVTQKSVRKNVREISGYWSKRVQDPLPESILKEANLMPLSVTLDQVHFPDSWEHLEASRHRLAFDEIFLLQLGAMRQRAEWDQREGTVFNVELAWLDSQFARLPYELTGAQRKSIDDIRTDLAKGKPMNRLLQGDVGAGKTIVAAMAIAMVVNGGGQSAIMAPTSILAEQHYQGLTHLLASEGAVMQPNEVRLMVGATSDSEKAEIRAGLESGEVKLVIGTHALIEPDVIFQNLQMIVIDEQHRFGVEQRGLLREKGNSPHLLVMTATPIPRSLALTLYGELDLSVMDEMPPGRQEIGTHVLRPIERERSYTLVEREVGAGHQVFIIYPLVEETDKSDSKAAVEEHKRLEQVFPKMSLGLLHGRLKADEKDAVMARFRDGEHQILVSTSVVEVGVDVPNATVMIVEGANRFGLAQLHQFRGRVGRGQSKSWCLLIPESDNAVENERLQAMAETNDGFVLAERDLEQRGPGQFLGTQQSGYSELKMASITDVKLIEKARSFAQKLFDEDPGLEKDEHRWITRTLDRFWELMKADVS
jgi:ATP-dependent DNA helicase RecG